MVYISHSTKETIAWLAILAFAALYLVPAMIRRRFMKHLDQASRDSLQLEPDPQEKPWSRYPMFSFSTGAQLHVAWRSVLPQGWRYRYAHGDVNRWVGRASSTTVFRGDVLGFSLPDSLGRKIGGEFAFAGNTRFITPFFLVVQVMVWGFLGMVVLGFLEAIFVKGYIFWPLVALLVMSPIVLGAVAGGSLGRRIEDKQRRPFDRARLIARTGIGDKVADQVIRADDPEVAAWAMHLLFRTLPQMGIRSQRCHLYLNREECLLFINWRGSMLQRAAWRSLPLVGRYSPQAALDNEQRRIDGEAQQIWHSLHDLQTALAGRPDAPAAEDMAGTESVPAAG